MSKKWDVKVDDQPYHIEYKRAKVYVNEEKHKVRKLYRKMGFFQTQYRVPVGSKMALLVVGMFNNARLVIDDKDCATGEDYVPQKLPAWAWIFIVLHFVNCLFGYLGAFMAIIGWTLTLSISCNRKMSIVVRVLLDLVILVAAVGIMFGVSWAVYTAAY